MPTAPTIVSVLAFAAGYIRVSWSNSGTGDYNQLYRSSPDGLPIKLADNMMWSPIAGRFRDYSVAVGQSYVYSVVAVEGTATAESVSASLILTRSQGIIHVVDKSGVISEVGGDGGVYTNAMVDTTSATGVSMSILDVIPHNRSYSLEIAQYPTAGANIPSLGVSAIEQVGVDFTIRIPIVNDTNRATIRDMITSRRYVCYRDTRGNKFFGRLFYDERYEVGFTDLAVRFQVLDFSEAVA